MISLALLLIVVSQTVYAAPAQQGSDLLNLNIAGGKNWTDNITMMLFLTMMTLSPAIILTMTCFPRYIITLSFMRQAIGIQQLPPNQMLIGLAFFMTIFTMSPTLTDIYNNAYVPYSKHQISSEVMFNRGMETTKKFMLRQTREKDLLLFAKHSGMKSLPSSREKLSPLVVIPAFIIGEFKTAFIMGFLLYLAFMAIDIIVASVLMSMGMMMLPPSMISLPLKILLFILSDGFYVLVNALMKSFH